MLKNESQAENETLCRPRTMDYRYCAFETAQGSMTAEVTRLLRNALKYY